MYFIRTNKDDEITLFSNRLDMIRKGRSIKYKVCNGLNIFSKKEGVQVYDKYTISNLCIDDFDYIRVAMIPSDSDVRQIKTDKYFHWVCDKIILTDKNYLYDKQTIVHFNIKVKDEFIQRISELGLVNILEWLEHYLNIIAY
uniref:Uncharacterized protein n=1 Tax=viral metagenome TaxID=1070528 RepID=A0A6C0E9F0_9ZZZZ